jgi:replicative DNA helicase
LVNAVVKIDGFVVEVEQNLLGALLMGADFRRVAGMLRPEHFIEDFHRDLFGYIGQAFSSLGSATILTVLKVMPDDARKAWELRLPVTVAQYLTGLHASTPVSQGRVEDAARHVIDQWARLTCGREASKVVAATVDPAGDPRKIIKTMAETLDAIGSDLRAGKRRKTRFTAGEAADLAIQETEAAIAHGNGLTGASWGLADLNYATGGIQRGEMFVIGARPSMGKTAFAGSVAIKTAKVGNGVGLLSLEMGATKIATRMLSDLAFDWNVSIPYADLITGRVQQRELDAVKTCSTDLRDLPVIIEEQGGLSITDIRVRLDRMAEALEKRNHPLKVLIVDYLQLVRPSQRYSGNKVGEITEISGGLRELAREYDIGVVALSQLSRGVEGRDDKRPTLSDLRDSGAIEQDADAVGFLFREAYYLEKAKGKDSDAEVDRVNRLIDCQNKLEFIIAKQRNGPVKTVDLFVDIACSAVRNAARNA